MSIISNVDRLFRLNHPKTVSAPSQKAPRVARADGFEAGTSKATDAAAVSALLRELLGGQAAAQPGAARGQTQYGVLAEKPAGYDATSLAAAYARFAAGFGMPIDARQRTNNDWQLNGIGAAGEPDVLDTADRAATIQLRDLVGQVGVAARDLSGLLRPVNPDDVDKFATGQTCRTGKNNPCNLTNADNVTLAIYDILQGNVDNGINAAGRPGGMSWEELAKQLESKYGIKSEVTTVTSKEGDVLKALKFEGGQVFCDGAGDGQADLGDYDFKGAVSDITARTGMSRESFAAGAADFKTDQTYLHSLQADLDGFLKESGALYKKLGDDFQKRWSEPLGVAQPSLPPWLTKLFADQTAKPTDPAQTDPAQTAAVNSREVFRHSLSDVYGLFALGFVLSDPNANTDPQPAV